MLSKTRAQTLVGILRLYRELDEEVKVFARKSGISCPQGCGACCLSPQVETTVAEMLPLAFWLFQKGEVEPTLDRLARNSSSICVQYEAHPDQVEKGRCLSYEHRPSLCRLFGFMGSRDRNGALRYGPCRVFQKNESERIQNVQENLQKNLLMIPQISLAHEQVAEIDGCLGTELLPINKALQRAIEIVGLDAQLEEQNAAGET